MKASESILWGSCTMSAVGLLVAMPLSAVAGLALTGAGLVGIILAAIVWFCEGDPL